jgi:hypothetical protein
MFTLPGNLSPDFRHGAGSAGADTLAGGKEIDERNN